jgi:ribonuclease P protein subunit POP4
MRIGKYLIYRDLIGLKIKILSHSDPSLVGVEGIVIDETANTLLIYLEHKHKKIKVPKLYGVYELELSPRKKIVLDGILIHCRPEDRLKRMLRR